MVIQMVIILIILAMLLTHKTLIEEENGDTQELYENLQENEVAIDALNFIVDTNEDIKDNSKVEKVFYIEERITDEELKEYLKTAKLKN